MEGVPAHYWPAHMALHNVVLNLGTLDGHAARLALADLFGTRDGLWISGWMRVAAGIVIGILALGQQIRIAFTRPIHRGRPGGHRGGHRGRPYRPRLLRRHLDRFRIPLGLRVLHPQAFQRINQDVRHHKVAIPLAVGRHQRPRRPGRGLVDTSS